MIIDKINQYLASENYKLDELLLDEVAKLSAFNFRRQFMEDNEKDRKLRLSSSGACARALAYRYLGYEPLGKEIDGRAKFTFFLGDLVELALLKVAKLSGCYLFATGLQQIEMSINIEGVEIKGHPDGFLLDNGKLYLVECKSMSDYSFNDFQKGNISEGYIAQVNMYMHILKLEKTVFVALGKNNSVIGEQIVEKDERIVNSIISKFKKVIKSDKKHLPPRSYKPDKKGKLPWQCLYCSYWMHCYPQAHKKVVNSRYQLWI